LRDELERRSPGLAPYFGKLPPMTHSDIARAFVELHDGFVRIYDLERDRRLDSGEALGFG
jgi:hypothetical protein